jgi:pilus assembly protein CpaE
LGASEFLYAPFENNTQHEAVSRLRRIRNPEPVEEVQSGSLIAFSSAKPGSGASTIALQAAFALKKATGKRVLLADFDLAGGCVGFYSKLSHSEPVFDALAGGGRLTQAMWSSMISNSNGVDVLTAPRNPFTGTVETKLLSGVLEFVRSNYDWTLIDLPAVFENWSLAVLSQADCGLLVSTPELPSVHLARKAVRYLDQLGFPRERFQLLINRVNRRDEISRTHLERLFDCTVHSRLPNDFFSLNRLATLGEPLEEGSELGKAMIKFAARLSATTVPARATQGAILARV